MIPAKLGILLVGFPSVLSAVEIITVFPKSQKVFSLETNGYNSVWEWHLPMAGLNDGLSSCLPLLTLPQKTSLLRETSVLPHSYPMFQPPVPLNMSPSESLDRTQGAAATLQQLQCHWVPFVIALSSHAGTAIAASLLESSSLPRILAASWNEGSLL